MLPTVHNFSGTFNREMVGAINSSSQMCDKLKALKIVGRALTVIADGPEIEGWDADAYELLTQIPGLALGPLNTMLSHGAAVREQLEHYNSLQDDLTTQLKAATAERDTLRMSALIDKRIAAVSAARVQNTPGSGGFTLHSNFGTPGPEGPTSTLSAASATSSTLVTSVQIQGHTKHLSDPLTSHMARACSLATQKTITGRFRLLSEQKGFCPEFPEGVSSDIDKTALKNLAANPATAIFYLFIDMSMADGGDMTSENGGEHDFRPGLPSCLNLHQGPHITVSLISTTDPQTSDIATGREEVQPRGFKLSATSSISSSIVGVGTRSALLVPIRPGDPAGCRGLRHGAHREPIGPVQDHSAYAPATPSPFDMYKATKSERHRPSTAVPAQKAFIPAAFPTTDQHWKKSALRKSRAQRLSAATKAGGNPTNRGRTSEYDDEYIQWEVEDPQEAQRGWKRHQATGFYADAVVHDWCSETQKKFTNEVFAPSEMGQGGQGMGMG
ncbi:hypothetical protein B484DRAFT_400184, partial [Ochromonadaceae sp. CCMP2298]